jgi:hypothetical protein
VFFYDIIKGWEGGWARKMGKGARGAGYSARPPNIIQEKKAMSRGTEKDISTALGMVGIEEVSRKVRSMVEIEEVSRGSRKRLQEGTRFGGRFLWRYRTKGFRTAENGLV